MRVQYTMQVTSPMHVYRVLSTVKKEQLVVGF